MENNDLLKQATLGKRVIAFLIDFLLAFVIGTILNAFVTGTYMYDAIGGNKVTQEYYSFAKDSGLVNVVEKDDGTIQNFYLFGYTGDGQANSSYSLVETPNNVPGYQAYLDIVWSYYTEFYPTDSRMNKPDGYTYSKDECDSYKEYVYTNVFLLPDPASVKDKADAIRYSSDAAHPYFEYATKEDGTPDITAKPVLRDSYVAIINGEDASKKEETLTNLRNYFLNITLSNSTASVSGGIYYNAVLDMEGQNSSIQTYFSSKTTEASYLSWCCSLVALLPLYLIFFFVIPVIDKQGRTLGKFIMRFSVVREDAVLMRWYQRVGRPLLMLVLVSLTLIPNSYYSIIIFVGVSLLDFAFLALTRKGKSLHDRLCKTCVVFTKDSTFFSNYEDKEEYLASMKNEEKQNEFDDAKLLAENSILDMSTINLRRDEAKNITSFDEFEKKKDEEMQAAEENNANQVNLHKEEED